MFARTTLFNAMSRTSIVAIFCIFLFITVQAVGQTINVMTYNLRYATENDGVNAWSKRKEKVFELIKKYDPDVIGVQEALISQITDILEAVPAYDYIGVGRDDGKQGGEYSAILYKKDRFTINESNTFWLSKTPETPGSKDWDAAITRVASWAKMTDKKSRTEFFMLNTHFDHIGKTAREQSAALLKKQAAKIAGTLPVIITGDFNFQRDDTPYPVMMSPESLQLHDPAPKNAPGTYCTFVVNGPECQAIDYIFHTSQWRSSGYKVITDNDGKHYPSDHLPVMVQLKLGSK